MKKIAVLCAGLLLFLVSGTQSIGKDQLRYQPYSGPVYPIHSHTEPPKTIYDTFSKDQTHLTSSSLLESDIEVITIKPPKLIVTTNETIGSNKAREYALSRLGSVQYHCIDLLFTRESHWRTHALNRSSGAYGIPQALPGSKMATFGDDWRDNPITQVKWGIHYVNVIYGSACGAWAHSEKYGWY